MITELEVSNFTIMFSYQISCTITRPSPSNLREESFPIGFATESHFLFFDALAFLSTDNVEGEAGVSFIKSKESCVSDVICTSVVFMHRYNFPTLTF